MSKRRFAILGLGQFGFALASELAAIGCEVMAVDRDADRIDEIRDNVAGAAVADIGDAEALKEIFCRPFDVVVISTGESLEAAIMATLHIKTLGVEEIWVEAANDDRAEVLKRVGATRTLQPEAQMGKRLAKRMAHPNLLEYLPLAPGYSVVEMDAPPSTHGKTLAELDMRNAHSIAVIAIRSADGAIKIVPGGAALVSEGDVFTLVGHDRDVVAFQASK